MSDSAIRSSYAALYGASVRLFVNFTRAREAAAVPHKRKTAKKK
jgi:hypothetical protein